MRFFLWFFLYFFLANLVLPSAGAFGQGVLVIIPIFISSLNLAYYSVSLAPRSVHAAGFWVFAYVFLGLAPISQMASGSFPWLDNYTTEVIDYSWILVSAGMLSYMFGYWLGLHGVVLRAEDVAQKYISYLPYMVAMGVGLSMFGIMYNGVGMLFVSRHELFSSMDSSGSSVFMLVQALMRVPLFFVTLISLYVTLEYKRYFYVSCILIAFVLVVNNPLSTPRYWFGTVVLSILFLYVALRHWRMVRFFSVSLILILVLVFPVMDVFRKTLDADFLTAVEDFSALEDLETSPDFDAFQQLMNTVVYVDIYGVEHGRQFLSSLFFWVPRFLWEGKSQPSGLMVAESLGYSFTNLSSPLWAEFYIDFGLLGLVVGMALFGFAFARVSIKGGGVWVVLSVFLCAYQIYFLRGSLMVTSNFMIVYLVCFYLLLKFLRVERK